MGVAEKGESDEDVEDAVNGGDIVIHDFPTCQSV